MIALSTGRSFLRAFWTWCSSSGLSPAAEQLAGATIARILPWTVIGCGIAAFLGALAHILFLEPGYRPFILPAHASFIGLGVYWLRKPPARQNVALHFATLYLSLVVSAYILLGEFSSTIHFGVLIVGGFYLSLDRRVLLVHLAIWILCLAVIASNWLPNGEGLPVLIVCLISAVGGGLMREMRLAGIEEIVKLQTQLEQTIGEREAAIQRALAAEKMESLGVMAAGVAHDYNNLLVGVVGGADLAALAQTEEEMAEALQTIRASAESLSGLSAQLLEVSGGRPIIKQYANLNELVLKTLDALDPRSSTGERVRCHLDAHLPQVLCEPESLQQVVANLVTNALQVASAKSGAVIVGTRTLSASAEHGQATPGRDTKEAVLWVEDDGPGIPAEIVSRIFDPFFTTRATGRGLGLATARAIVQRHEGEICFMQRPGGALFEVRLPGVVVSEHTGAAGRQTGRQPLRPAIPLFPTEASPSRKIPLLLVDDDSRVRDVTSRMLSRIGFDVLEAGSGQQALEEYLAAPDKPSVAVVDALMPTLDGPETIRRLRDIAPGLPVLLYSGYHYSADQVAELPTSVHFLAKPFNAEQLREALSELLLLSLPH